MKKTIREPHPTPLSAQPNSPLRFPEAAPGQQPRADHTIDPRILVAGDDPARAMALEGALKARGFLHVRSTADAREITALYNKWPYEVLFLDMQMTSSDAVLVLASLSNQVRAHALAIIAQVDANDYHMAERALLFGALDVCTLDVDASEAVVRLRAAMEWIERHSSPTPDADNITDIGLARKSRQRISW